MDPLEDPAQLNGTGAATEDVQRLDGERSVAAASDAASDAGGGGERSRAISSAAQSIQRQSSTVSGQQSAYSETVTTTGTTTSVSETPSSAAAPAAAEAEQSEAVRYDEVIAWIKQHVTLPGYSPELHWSEHHDEVQSVFQIA